MNNSLTAKRTRPADVLAYGAIYLCAFFSVALLAVLLGYVLFRSTSMHRAAGHPFGGGRGSIPE